MYTAYLLQSLVTLGWLVIGSVLSPQNTSQALCPVSSRERGIAIASHQARRPGPRTCYELWPYPRQQEGVYHASAGTAA